MSRGEVRIPHRHLDPPVSEEHLNGANVDPRHDQIRGEGVPQVVEVA
jgi:hypothetical protein